MTTINWERESGDRIEEFVAAALVLQHGEGCRITPSRGDGGIDVLLPLDAKTWWVVQVKRYSSPLDAKQAFSVEHSYAALRDEDILGLDVARWSIAMPWDPTRQRLAWLRAFHKPSELMRIDWMGRATLDALAADNPRLVDYYFGDGADRLARLMARALDASTPAGGKGPDELLTAAVSRMGDVAASLDEVDPFYRYELAPVDTLPRGRSTIEHLDGAAAVRFTTTPNGRHFRLRIVARHSLAAVFRPIRHTVVVPAGAESAERRALKDFHDLGKPFVGIQGTVVEAVGPPGTTTTGASVISLFVAPHEHLPPMEVVLCDKYNNELSALPLLPVRANHGTIGDGFWVASSDRSGAIEVEVKSRRPGGEISLDMKFATPVGAAAAHVAGAVRFGRILSHGGWVLLRTIGGPPLVGPFQVEPGRGPEGLWFILDLFVRLQAHTHDVVRIPDVGTISNDEFGRLDFHLKVLSGDEVESEWHKQLLSGVATALPKGTFSGRTLHDIEMPLAGVDVEIAQVIEQRFVSCRIDTDAVLPEGDVVAVVPADTNLTRLRAIARPADVTPGVWETGPGQG